MAGWTLGPPPVWAFPDSRSGGCHEPKRFRPIRRIVLQAGHRPLIRASSSGLALVLGPGEHEVRPPRPGSLAGPPAGERPARFGFRAGQASEEPREAGPTRCRARVKAAATERMPSFEARSRRMPCSRDPSAGILRPVRREPEDDVAVSRGRIQQDVGVDHQATTIG